jgi:hypothetical protein
MSLIHILVDLNKIFLRLLLCDRKYFSKTALVGNKIFNLSTLFISHRDVSTSLISRIFSVHFLCRCTKNDILFHNVSLKMWDFI